MKRFDVSKSAISENSNIHDEHAEIYISYVTDGELLQLQEAIYEYLSAKGKSKEMEQLAEFIKNDIQSEQMGISEKDAANFEGKAG